jgi:Beta-galactosidase
MLSLMLAHSTGRPAIVAVRAVLFFAGLPWLAPSLAMAQDGYARKPVPSGLAAVIKNDPAQPLDVKPFANPYIRIVALQIHWRDIEPAPGKFNWDRLDQLFNVAHTSHKWVHLYVFSGFFSPAWALQGAEVDTFTVPYGPASGANLPLPMPYDPVYLRNWFSFVKQLSARYGERPEFLTIGADGPTSVSDEFTEPDDKASIAKWLFHHYTSTKYLEAWNQTFKTFAELFPNQYVSLSLGNGVAINAEGVYDPNENDRMHQEVVSEGLATLGRQFVLQSSSLRGNGHHDTVHDFLISFNGRVATGFQLSTTCINSPAAMGAAGNPPLALILTIQNGMRPNPINGLHVDYIEIYSDDVEAAQMQPVLRWAASLFE